MLSMNRVKALYILELNSYQFEYLGPDDIQRAYRRCALRKHPDKSNGLYTEEDFHELQMARDFLLMTSSGSTPIKNNNGKFEQYGRMTLLLIKILKVCVMEFIKQNWECRNNNDSEFNNNTKSTTFSSSSSTTTEEEEDEDEGMFYDVDDDFTDTDDTQFESTQNSTTLTMVLNVTVRELYTEYGKKLDIKCRDKDNEYLNRIIYISFDPYEIINTYVGMGDWDNNSNRYGDVIVKLNIIQDECFVDMVLDKYELVRNISIDLYEYYYGVEFVLEHYGTSIPINHQPLVDGMDMYIPYQGLQRGHGKRGGLYLMFTVVHEKTVNLKQDVVRRVLFDNFHGMKRRNR